MTISQIHIETEWSKAVCEVNIQQYQNGRTCLQLIDTEDGCPYTTATVNVPEQSLHDDEVIIKTHSENAGVLSALRSSGWIKEVVKIIPLGYTTATICRLSDQAVHRIKTALS